MNKLHVSLAFLILLSFLCAPVLAAQKKLVSQISVTVRTDKHGKKVDLAKSPEYKEALAEFKDKKFGPAVDKFEDLDGHGYCCDLVHYYIAQCYHQTNQLQSAKMHYSWVYEYSKDPTLRYYSQNAYQQLAYYGGHRTYTGQGNNFQKTIAGRPTSAGSPPGSDGGGPPPRRGFS